MAIWLNGERVNGAPTAFDLNDRGLLLGDGVFDTALILEGRAVYRDAHLARLEAACRTIGLSVDGKTLAAAMDEAAEGVALGSVRLTVTRGPGPRGIVAPRISRPTVIASHAKSVSSTAFQATSLWPGPIRRNETSPCSRIKTLGYLDTIMATQDARERGFDEALFLNCQGRVACAGTGNLFILVGRSLVTPPLDEGVLPGVIRAAVMRLATELQLDVWERPIDLADVMGADAVFMTNSLRLMAQVRTIGEHPVSMRCGGIFASLTAALLVDISRVHQVDPRPYLEPGGCV